MKTQRDSDVDYFADKAIKRMNDFAVYGKSVPINVRGETCLDKFGKNSNREWAQKFFMLNLGRSLST